MTDRRRTSSEVRLDARRMALELGRSQGTHEHCPACGGEGIVSLRNGELIRRVLPVTERGTMPDLPTLEDG